MTSLEQEESKGNDSVSDYDYDHWDTENWGDMEHVGTGEQQSSSTSEARSPPIATQTPKVEGWDNEEWGSLEEEPVSQKIF